MGSRGCLRFETGFNASTRIPAAFGGSVALLPRFRLVGGVAKQYRHNICSPFPAYKTTL